MEVFWTGASFKCGEKDNISYPAKIFNYTFNIEKAEHDLSVVSYEPLFVGFCNVNASTTELDRRNCPLNHTVSVKPGKTFSVSAVIMGQHYGLFNSPTAVQPIY